MLLCLLAMFGAGQVWRFMDEQLRDTPMPDEYKNIRVRGGIVLLLCPAVGLGPLWLARLSNGHHHDDDSTSSILSLGI
jgi:hypothetical protein